MKKLLISLVLVFFISISTVEAYAYYEDSQMSYVTNEQPQILLSQDFVTNNDKNLVPTGSILGVNDVEEITFTYTLFVQEGLDVELDIQNLLFANEPSVTLSQYFNFDYDVDVLSEDTLKTDLFEAAEDGYYVAITLHVTMDQPTMEDYALLANQQFTFEVLFKAL